MNTLKNVIDQENANRSNYYEPESEIANVVTEHTGGNIYNDIIELKSGQVLVISPDTITYFQDLDHYYENWPCIKMINRFE